MRSSFCLKVAYHDEVEVALLVELEVVDLLHCDGVVEHADLRLDRSERSDFRQTLERRNVFVAFVSRKIEVDHTQQVFAAFLSVLVEVFLRGASVWHVCRQVLDALSHVIQTRPAAWTQKTSWVLQSEAGARALLSPVSFWQVKTQLSRTE